jgi:hypothetical protein
MKHLKATIKKTDKFNLIAATVTILLFTPIIIALLRDLLTNGSNIL